MLNLGVGTFITQKERNYLLDLGTQVENLEMENDALSASLDNQQEVLDAYSKAMGDYEKTIDRLTAEKQELQAELQKVLTLLGNLPLGGLRPLEEDGEPITTPSMSAIKSRTKRPKNNGNTDPKEEVE